MWKDGWTDGHEKVKKFCITASDEKMLVRLVTDKRTALSLSVPCVFGQVN